MVGVGIESKEKWERPWQDGFKGEEVRGSESKGPRYMEMRGKEGTGAGV